MRKEIIEKTYLTFDELSDEQKAVVIEKYRDINVNYDWWAFVYDDAQRVGLSAHGFSIGRDYYLDLRFEDDAVTVAENIIRNHGEWCNTYKTAKAFLDAIKPYRRWIDKLDVRWLDGTDHYMGGKTITKAQPIGHDLEYFEKPWHKCVLTMRAALNEAWESFYDDITSNYLSMLSDEYDYRTSDEAVEETLIVNEYEFDVDTLDIV